jgi:hypothetical protein
MKYKQMKYILIIFMFLFLNFSLFSRDSTNVFTGINFRFDNRYCLNQNKIYWIPAFKLGVTLNNKHRIGFGFNYLYSKINNNLSIQENNINYQFKEPLHLYYVSLFYEWIIYQQKRWEFYIPFQFGYGTSYYTYFLNGERVYYEKEPVINFESVIGGHYKVFWWGGVGAGAGYQYMLKSNHYNNGLTSGVIFYGKIKIFVGDMYNHFIRHPRI